MATMRPIKKAIKKGMACAPWMNANESVDSRMVTAAFGLARFNPVI